MKSYCLEVGTGGDATVHQTDCGNYDHASLLGQGRLFGLGKHESSAAALKSVQQNFPTALRCLDCCREELICSSSRVARGKTPNVVPPLSSRTRFCSMPAVV